MLQISIKYNDAEVKAKMARVLAAVKNKQKLLNAIGITAQTAVEKNFQRQEDSKGRKWKPSIRAQEQNGKTLMDKGNLSMITFNTDPANNSVLVGTTVRKYGEYMQYGRSTPIYAKGAAMKFYIGSRGPIFAKSTKGYAAREWLYIGKQGKANLLATIEHFYKDAFK